MGLTRARCAGKPSLPRKATSLRSPAIRTRRVYTVAVELGVNRSLGYFMIDRRILFVLVVSLTALTAQAQTRTVQIDSVLGQSATLVIEASSDSSVTIRTRSAVAKSFLPLGIAPVQSWLAAVDTVLQMPMSPDVGQELRAHAETEYPTVGGIRLSRVVRPGDETFILASHNNGMTEVLTALTRVQVIQLKRALNAAILRAQELSRR